MSAWARYAQSAQDGKRARRTSHAGMRYDEIGLYVAPKRTNVPGIGGWLQMDPAGTADGLNSYAYVHASPLGLIALRSCPNAGHRRAAWPQPDHVPPHVAASGSRSTR
nr:RHS repeat-associated core domain-containing protein [Nitrospirillum amazonense]